MNESKDDLSHSPIPPTPPTGQELQERADLLVAELTNLINRHSLENESDTPDYILANYLLGCLEAFKIAVRNRDGWWGFKPWGRKHEC